MTPEVSLLAPAAILVAWTLVILGWTAAARLPAFKKVGVDINVTAGARYSDVEDQMPPRVNWVGHNHTHLMEQPTVFYAVIMILALTGDTAPSTLICAWGYTGLRIAHSLWQVLVNQIPVRFMLFLASTACLTFLSVRALIQTLAV